LLKQLKIYFLINALKIKRHSIPQSLKVPLSKIKDVYFMNSLKSTRKQAKNCVKNKDTRDFLEIYMKRSG